MSGREVYDCRECAVSHSVVWVKGKRYAVCEYSYPLDETRFRREGDKIEIRSRVNS